MQSGDPAHDRELDDFCSRISAHIKGRNELLLDGQPNSPSNCDNSNSLSLVPTQEVGQTSTTGPLVPTSTGEGKKNSKLKLYGDIKKEDFINILEQFDKNSRDSRLKGKPVTCSNLKGGCFDSHLFAQQGFHHLGSTAILAKELGINEADRVTFLGGYSTYSPRAGQSLGEIKEKNEQHQRQHYLNKICDFYLRDPDLTEVSYPAVEVDYILDKDPHNSDALAAKGLFFMKGHRKLEEATRCLEKSLDGRPKYRNMVIKYVSIAFSDLAHNLYLAKKYREAKQSARRALHYDPELETAKMIEGVISDCIHRTTPFSSRHRVEYRK